MGGNTDFGENQVSFSIPICSVCNPHMSREGQESVSSDEEERSSENLTAAATVVRADHS